MGAGTNTTHRAPVATPAPSIGQEATSARWRAAFWVTFGLLGVAKLWIAATLSLFVDEAFYWQESRHLAWSYFDVPGLTAWMIAGSEAVLGHSTLAVRAPFLALGTAVPLMSVILARRMFGANAGWRAGLWTLVLPLAGTLGVLALPDVPLVFASMLAFVALERMASEGRLRDGCLLGVALAIAWLSHYRAAMLMFAGLVFLIVTPRGRRLWRWPGLWVALLIAALGLMPLLAFNLDNDWSAFGFQFVERHPWAFHADALLQPLEQALVVTPPLFILLGLPLWVALRRMRDGAPWDLFAAVSLPTLGAWFVLGLFADGERFRVHWPLAAYLPLLALLPRVLDERIRDGRHPETWRIAAICSAAFAALGTLTVLAYLAAASHPAGANRLAAYKAFPSHFVGWNEAGAAARDLLAADRSGGIILVADNFMLAAELDFALGGRRPVYALDSPLNVKHGRAGQLASWQRDESALRAHAGQRALLVVDETALRERERAAWLDGLCRRLGPLQEVQRIDLFDRRKRLVFLTAVLPAYEQEQGCGVRGTSLTTERERPPHAASGTP
jgi:4-amino-4-deoxy-L-arabinose transferase-like glycosyltransferase